MPLVAGPPQRSFLTVRKPAAVDPLYDIDPHIVQSWERESGPLGPKEDCTSMEMETNIM
jgi:hypothetical protein